MKKSLLKSKIQWLGWISVGIFGFTIILILFSEYFYLTLFLAAPLIFILWKAPYAWDFSKDGFRVRTVLGNQHFTYTQIDKVELLYPNARIGHIIKFRMKNGKDFSIDYQNEYWAQDLCNLLMFEQVSIINKDFQWLQYKDDMYFVKNFYPRNNIEIERENFILDVYCIKKAR